MVEMQPVFLEWVVAMTLMSMRYLYTLFPGVKLEKRARFHLALDHHDHLDMSFALHCVSWMHDRPSILVHGSRSDNPLSRTYAT